MSISNHFNPKKTTRLFELKEQFSFLEELINNKRFPNVLLLSGRKGIGKSTLALQTLSSFKQNVLYASAEESEEQIALRAKRLNVLSSNIHLSSENRIDEILSGNRLNEIIDVLLAQEESDRLSQLSEAN